MHSKVCFKCLKDKPIVEYYKHKQMGDGHLSKCKECTKRDSTKHRWDNISKIREYDNERSKLPHRIKRQAENTKKFRKNFPEKYSAHNLLASALKNRRIIRPLTCEFCKQEKKLEAHHPDYYKPLDVQWLCKSCHRCLHRDMKAQI